MKNLTNTAAPKSLSLQLGSASNPNFCLSGGCTLKFNLVNKLQNANAKSVPYLEYRIRKYTTLNTDESCFSQYPPLGTCGSYGAMELDSAIALPFTTVSSEGMANGFRRTNKRDLQQLTTSEELDFAVFQ
jgi:hypothetical protein